MTKKLPPRKAIKKEIETGEEYSWVPDQIENHDVRIWRYDGPRHTPEGDNDPSQGSVPERMPYMFIPEHLREVAWAVWPHDGTRPTPCLLVGPKGCGKTSLVTQLAARANQRLYRINLNVGTSVRHLKGHRGAAHGGTVFYSGVVTRAMEEGAWLLLDEISGASPHVALSLFPILEPDGEVWLEDAEPPRYVKRHPDFRLFATDNVIGSSQEDNRFQYSGTNPDQNEALLDRFHSTIECGYPDVKEEHRIVRLALPHLQDKHDDFIQFVIRIVDKIRKDQNAPGFSIRMTIEWCRRITAGHMDATGKRLPLNPDQILEAANYAFLNKLRSKADRLVVEEVIRRVLSNLRRSP